ncbi:MAG TPA: DNA methyltransferase, partial [Candidatus Eisenbacteria bacterium]|nr:DNA methyltransferase [Candidatus Eisenbacteria bacterium]
PKPLTVKDEYASLVPQISEEEYQTIIQSIKDNGQWVPIITNPQLIILDGHTRFRACKELGLQPRITVREFEDPLLEKQFIIQINRNRRHLTSFQRIELECKYDAIQSELAKKRMSEAGKIGAEKRWKGRDKTDEAKESRSTDRVRQNYTTPSNVSKSAGKTEVAGRAIDISAKNAQVSPATYNKGRKIIDSAPPAEVLNKLRTGQMTVHRAYRQINNQKKIQDLKSKDANCNVKFPDNVKLIEGDLAEKCRDIQAKSIDLIFTDPCYDDNKSLPIYDELAKVAATLLKDGGSLVISSGQNLKYEVIQLMKSRGLTPWWEIAIIQHKSHSKISVKKVIVKWKPLLWFVKGSEPKISDYIEDIVESQYPDNTIDRDIESTAESEHVISKLTVQGEVVLDPLMGTGTTGIAAIKLKRRFSGIEKNPDKLLTAKGRISNFLGHQNEGEEKIMNDNSSSSSMTSL